MDTQETHPIHSFTKNQDEEIRLNVRKYNGKYFIDLRVWYRPEQGGVFRPTKKGVFFAMEQLSEFKRGVDRLLKAAEKFTVKEEVEV